MKIAKSSDEIFARMLDFAFSVVMMFQTDDPRGEQDARSSASDTRERNHVTFTEHGTLPDAIDVQEDTDQHVEEFLGMSPVERRYSFS